MKLKRTISLFLTIAMLLTLLVGCGNGASEQQGDNTGETGTKELLTIDIFDVAANYQGVQTGWFGKVVKDKFNIELNIIAPQVAGDAVYQTRTSTGNLGDIVILEKSSFADCVKAGLIKDISAEIGSYTNLMTYDDQIGVFNKGLEGNDGKTYGIPCKMTNTSATSYSQDVIYSSPLLRWDLYTGIGAPDIADLEGLLDVLAQMKEKYPTNTDGDACYPLSLWADWDGGDGMMGIANVVQLTTWYGEKIKQSVILKPDDTFIPVTSKDGSYYKMLKFLNEANRRGLVDPDSGTQNWDSACAKMSSGRVYLMWYSWQVGFWNTQERISNGNAFIFTPVKDQTYYCDSDTYFGDTRVFGVGSGVSGEKYTRIMEFLDWYASPEGLVYEHSGLKDFNYSIGADGKYTLMNDNALMDNLTVPDIYGGGGYSDGNNAINQWIVDAISTNPNTGEAYNKDYWSTYKEAIKTQMKRDWAAKFGADEPVDYMKANNVLLVSPNVSVQLPSDSADITVTRNECGTVFNDYSWKMIFAENDAKFDAMWDEMCVTMDGLGYQTLVELDKTVYQIEVDAKNAVK